MNKRLSIILLVIFVLSFTLVACSKPKDSGSTVAIPMVGSSASDGQTTGGESQTTGEVVYPVDEQLSIMQSTYPIDKNSPTFDAEMEEWVKGLLGDKHTLDFILSQNKTEAEWRELLQNPDHLHLNLGYTELESLIEWLLEKSK